MDNKLPTKTAKIMSLKNLHACGVHLLLLYHILNMQLMNVYIILLINILPAFY